MVFNIISTIMLFIVVGILFWQASLLFSAIFGAPTVYANSQAIRDAYKLSGLKQGETVLDLGCGNAKSLIIASKEFGAKGIGVEISPYCYLKSRWNVLVSGQNQRIKIYLADLKKSRRLIEGADVIYLYLLNSVLSKIEPEIFNNIKEDTRVVTLAFKFNNHQPIKIVHTQNLGKDTEIKLYQK